jgi:1,2-diacylglycerol 3-beta-galactosyltransferase
MSDTGGGHRAAAEAIRDALYRRYGEANVAATLLDVFKASRFPFNYMPELYPWLVNRSKSSYSMGFRLSDTRRRAALLSRVYYATNIRRFKKMIRANPADVVVCVHSIINRAAKSAYNALDTRPPFITVVTDLVSTHYFWFDRTVERCLVPTEAAYQRGLEAGLQPQQMRVTGLPVHPEFMERLTDKAAARQALHWHADKPAVLMVAGGDGMGPLYETARAIDEKRLDCQLAIVAGRNQALKTRLESATWQQPVHIYGFVRNMPQLMAAADMIVTKAGPATITEAAIAGLPMILSDAIPGQEEGNVTYVIDNEAGAYAPQPALVADTVEQWLREGPDGLTRRAQQARRIASAEAVWRIAEEVWDWAQHPPLTQPRRRTLWRQRK